MGGRAELHIAESNHTGVARQGSLLGCVGDEASSTVHERVTHHR